ncbi:uncharacterized protein L969DRAFT_86565 [Mixia osmundae IAM 14324]|uniref:Endoplasmic reticulum junction formation protein lunapark n=1 Tax=Mixia osmundae (strain CBS 9802 / IAM 14324 / JCM 22182 / KY 12970) TaxID=764103 RepID=G7E9L0_MIXOS|nr:uncharacterized protein L969DRAFT_86565 [Mixia osmundae IAM 14324]KEI39960.1 hypothetical protein L969DRAFT_86565 [Mixia osmundae IAM 14324]GAA99329.1 hypothetical protein E5Q_06024 [Mixia osmundae IAM 14324]
MGILSWLGFSKGCDSNDEVERQLQLLDEKVQQNEEKLAQIRSRERRALVFFTLYSAVIWLAYFALWYYNAVRLIAPGDWGKHLLGLQSEQQKLLGVRADTWERIIRTLPVLVGPFVITFQRRFFRWWYTRKGNAEIRILEQLRARQQEQVDKLKKRLRYEETRALIDKYDSKNRPAIGNKGLKKSASTTSLRSHSGTPQGSPTLQADTSKRAPVFPPPPPFANTAFKGSPAVSINGRDTSTVSPLSTPVRGSAIPGALSREFAGAYPPTPTRGWVDKIADALLGENEQLPTSKYALICQKCFSHNGLALKEELDEIQYTCPRCGHFNSRRKSTKDSTTVRPRGSNALPTSSLARPPINASDEDEASSPTTQTQAEKSKSKKSKQPDVDDSPDSSFSFDSSDKPLTRSSSRLRAQ